MSAGNMSSVGGGYHHSHHHHHHHQADDAQSSRSGDTPGPHSHSNLNSYANCDHNSDGGTWHTHFSLSGTTSGCAGSPDIESLGTDNSRRFFCRLSCTQPTVSKRSPKVVTYQLQVERRTGKVRRSQTDVLPLYKATTLSRKTASVEFKFWRRPLGLKTEPLLHAIAYSRHRQNTDGV